MVFPAYGARRQTCGKLTVMLLCWNSTVRKRIEQEKAEVVVGRWKWGGKEYKYKLLTELLEMPERQW